MLLNTIKSNYDEDKEIDAHLEQKRKWQPYSLSVGSGR